MSTIDAASQKMDFMTLLVTELKYQNPLEPMDNQQMAAQLAQFSQLELTEGMNGNLQTMNETMTKMNTSFEGA
ncbi:MAG: flagellar hook capping FlgD N-terminal domain-containing protein, partial [Anaerohalosphaeraceae bacterium]